MKLRGINVDDILHWLTDNRNEANVAGMAHFAISGSEVMGIRLPALRAKARTCGHDTDAARLLWQSGIHEARIMASMIADPHDFTLADMECWCADFDSWDVCDQCCLNLFWQLPFAKDAIEVCAADEREFVRRCAFALMAVMAVHAEPDDNIDFAHWLHIIREYSTDRRNFVKKAVNWALRQIGKRSMALNTLAVDTARQLAESDNSTARWIGKNALNELTSTRTVEFIKSHRESRFGTPAE